MRRWIYVISRPSLSARLIKRRWHNTKLQILRTFDRVLPNESQRVFVLTLIIGAACGLAAVAFHLGIIWAEENLIDRAMSSPNYALWAILTPTLGGLLGGILLTYVTPGARGSGIPSVKVAYAVKGGRLPFREVLGKFAIGILQIGSGASLGREGPTVHICAGIASFLGRAFALSQKNLKRLVPVGAAAGIAAGPPIVAYADETLASALSQMNKASARQLSVVSTETHKFLGIVTMADIVRAQAKGLPQ